MIRVHQIALPLDHPPEALPKAVAKRLVDFLVANPSTDLGSGRPSFASDVTPTDLSTALPEYVIEAILEVLPAFAKQIPGFDHPVAVLTGVETRTSSPMRITRGADLQSSNTPGLFPTDEGAGFA